MNLEDLKQYLITISKSGYATNDEKNWIKEADGSTTIVNNDWLWSMHDNFFGGEPYGGREVIFYERKPVWIMVYYGKVNEEIENHGEVYSFLQKSLKNTDPDFPLRGPKLFFGGGMQYINHWKGNIDEFEGKEQIVKDGKEIYSASYRGGLVDKRKE